MLRIFTASDWKGAERAFRRAIELNPDYPVARQWYAWHLAWTGRGDAAIPQMKRAMQLDPLSGPMRAQYLYILHLAGRDSAITAEVERRLTEAPDNPILFVHLGLAKLRQGHHTEAIAALRQAGERPGRRPDDYWFIQVPLAYAYAVAGQRQQAMEIANQPESRTEVASTALVDLAGVYTALGEKDKALQILEGYHRAGNIHRLVWLGSDPALAPLRSEPRYKRLLQQVRLE
jgi:tetratricopeptide (TPR) repeat protein